MGEVYQAPEDDFPFGTPDSYKFPCLSGATTLDCVGKAQIELTSSGKAVLLDAVVKFPGDLPAIGQQTDISFSISNGAFESSASSLFVTDLQLVSENSTFELVGYDPLALPVEIVPQKYVSASRVAKFKFTVRFHKLVAKSAFAQISIHMLHGSTNVYRFILVESAEPPKLKFESTLWFQNDDLSQIISKNIQLTNIGVGILKIVDLTFKADADLTLVDNACALPGEATGTAPLPLQLTVKPGESHQFCVTYVRTDQKGKSGKLTFKSNDPGLPSATVNVLVEQ